MFLKAANEREYDNQKQFWTVVFCKKISWWWQHVSVVHFCH